MKPILIVLLILINPQFIKNELHYNFVIWNVGQGSWSTFYTETLCVHFDGGGEKLPINSIAKLCKRKQNFFLITHDDWDHINGIIRVSKQIIFYCLYYPKKEMHKKIARLRKCEQLPGVVKILSHGTEGKSKNESSIVYLLAGQVLITGDAPQRAEKKWLTRLPQSAKILILGHHGSNTSTSKALLQRMKPWLSIASSRKAKYKHPHPKVIGRLNEKRVPTLVTETLGNIYLKLKIKSSERKAYIPIPNPRRPLRK